MKIAMLYSGGLDSFILKKYAEFVHPYAEIKYLYYAHGAESENAEILSLPDFVKVRRVEWLNNEYRALEKSHDAHSGPIWIPGRNLVFTALAACQELADEVWLGTVYDEDHSKNTDKNQKYMDLTSELLTHVLSPFKNEVRVRAPFVEHCWTKRDCVAWALENGATPEQLMATVSCWFLGGAKPCGQCKQCFKRWMVFKLNGFEEEYDQHPIDSPYGIKMLAALLDSKDANIDEATIINNIKEIWNRGEFPEKVMAYLDTRLK